MNASFFTGSERIEISDIFNCFKEAHQFCDKMRDLFSELFDIIDVFDDIDSNRYLYYQQHCSVELCIDFEIGGDGNWLHVTKCGGDGFAFQHAVKMLKRALVHKTMSLKKHLQRAKEKHAYVAYDEYDEYEEKDEKFIGVKLTKKHMLVTVEYIEMTVLYLQNVMEMLENESSYVRESALKTLAGLSSQPFSQTAILANADVVIPTVLKFLSDPDTVNTARYAATVLANLLQCEDRDFVGEIREKVVEYDTVKALSYLVMTTRTAETIRQVSQAMIAVGERVKEDVIERLLNHTCYEIREYGKMVACL